MQTSILILLVFVNGLQLLLVARVFSRLRGTARVNERLSHFAEALALLTDTTEAGLSGVASAMQQGRPPARSRSRAATARRIRTAVRRGCSVVQIAADESLSESEVRLHLGLSDDADSGKESGHGALRV